MKCIRCGRCCIELDIYIINPESIRPDGTIDIDLSVQMVLKPGGTRCPHLTYQEQIAVCTIHHLPCYRGTPCDLFDQFGPEDGICMMGCYYKDAKK